MNKEWKLDLIYLAFSSQTHTGNVYMDLTRISRDVHNDMVNRIEESTVEHGILRQGDALGESK